MRQTKTYKITLTTLEPLRIGGVEDPLSGIDNPVATVGGKLVVPGPSLKGLLRNTLERYLISKYWANGGWSQNNLHLQPCIPATKFTPDETKLVNEGKYRNASCHYPCKKDDKGNYKCGGPHGICPVCYLFGAMGVTGFVRIPFLIAEVSGNELYSSRIDRSIGTVVEGTNRPYQLVPQNAQFTGTIEVLIKDTVLDWELGKHRPFPDNQTKGDEWLKGNPRNPDELIKEFILTQLQSITLLGGYKSKGFGKVKIDVVENK